MNASENCIELIKSAEGFSPTLFEDTGGRPCIGYGCDLSPEEFDQYKGEIMTEEEADKLLRFRVSAVEAAINKLVTVQMTQGMFDGLCDFVYNCGPHAFEKSTLLRKLNAGDTQGASQEFVKWDHAGGVELAGLKARRERERDLFLEA